MWKTISNESGKAAGSAPVAGINPAPKVSFTSGGSMTPLQTSPLQVRRSPVLREFGSIERMHWLMDQNHCNHFAMAAEIRGHTTVTMWRNALDQLQRRHPLLNVFIGMKENSRLFYQAGDDKIPLVVRKRTSPLQWQAEFEKELSTPFDSSASPLMRAQLLLGDDRCEVILTTSSQHRRRYGHRVCHPRLAPGGVGRKACAVAGSSVTGRTPGAHPTNSATTDVRG